MVWNDDDITLTDKKRDASLKFLRHLILFLFLFSSMNSTADRIG